MILVRGLLVMFEEGVGLQTFTVGRSPSLLLLLQESFSKKGDSYNLKLFKYISILVLVLYI